MEQKSGHLLLPCWFTIKNSIPATGKQQLLLEGNCQGQNNPGAGKMQRFVIIPQQNSREKPAGVWVAEGPAQPLLSPAGWWALTGPCLDRRWYTSPAFDLYAFPQWWHFIAIFSSSEAAFPHFLMWYRYPMMLVKLPVQPCQHRRKRHWRKLFFKGLHNQCEQFANQSTVTYPDRAETGR